MIPYHSVSSGVGDSRPRAICKTRFMWNARFWRPGRRRHPEVALAVGGNEEVLGLARLLLPSRTVWMTIASIDTSRGVWTNYTTAQIWKSMCCQVWHSAQRDLSPLLQKTPLSEQKGWCVRLLVRASAPGHFLSQLSVKFAFWRTDRVGIYPPLEHRQPSAWGEDHQDQPPRSM